MRKLYKAKWEFVSKGNFGPIKLGMSKAEIYAILGDSDVSHGKKMVYPGMFEDIFGEKNVLVHYIERNGTKEAIYIEVNYPFNVLYAGKDLMGMSLEDVKLHFKMNGILIENTEVRLGHRREVCLLEGIGIDSSSAAEHLNSVYMFEDGYFEECEARWREYQKGLARRVKERDRHKKKAKPE